MLLIYLNEEETYELVFKLIVNIPSLHLFLDKAQFKSFIKETVNIVISEQPKFNNNIKALTSVVTDMVRKLFIGYFRVSCILRILMLYLFEGNGILIKIISSIFANIKIGHISKARSLIEITQEYTFSLLSCDNLIKQCFRINYLSNEPLDSRSSNMRNMYIENSKIVSEIYLQEILNHLDNSYRSLTPKAIYSSNSPSFSELIKASLEHEESTSMICILLTNNYEILGFFTDCALHPSKIDYGGTSCMVFLLEPEIKFYCAKKGKTVSVTDSCIKIGKKKPAIILEDENMNFISNASKDFKSPKILESDTIISICELIALI